MRTISLGEIQEDVASRKSFSGIGVSENEVSKKIKHQRFEAAISMKPLGTRSKLVKRYCGATSPSTLQ
jgi:hypothetical protein